MIGQKPVQYKEAQRIHHVMKVHRPATPSGIAIDGGAHVGSWTVEMCKYFSLVYAFEPCVESFQILLQNMVNEDLLDKTELFNNALADKNCFVKMIAPRGRDTLTARQMKVTSKGDVEAITIDSLGLSGCDLIKLDLEGAEALALEGARKTIDKFHPFLIVEFNNLVRQFGSSEDHLEKRIKKMGYQMVWRDGVDRGYRWEGAM